jgi:hypothetical protein
MEWMPLTWWIGMLAAFVLAAWLWWWLRKQKW